MYGRQPKTNRCCYDCGINERLIKVIDGDENKIKILLKEIYKKKLNELQELQRTPYIIKK